MKPFLQQIVTRAGELSLEYRARLSDMQVNSKGTVKDLVSEADIAVENFLIAQIRDRYPDHAICCEESGDHTGSEYRWIIDPIDGTTSFVHGMPFYSISIALEHRGQTILGAVFAPVLKELFLAEKGNGATLNGQPIGVSDRSVLSDCLCTTGFACLRANRDRNNLSAFARIAPKIRGTRILGSAAVDLCYIACGRTDGGWELNLNIYDLAAGMLMVQEAGGMATDFSGGTENLPGEILASNGKIHNQLSELLQCTNDEK
ncbi:MAG: inositol monophosphatase family protein [Planctomycetota bacterium]|jgi:myo-inositol-1(or 4)-monophosphatase